MGYPPRKWSAPRKIGSRKESGRAKSKRKKGRSGEAQISKEREGPTSQEVAKKALNTLNTLGSQKFALPPFSDYFDRWLMNLRSVILELGSSSAIQVDDQFKSDCSKILEDVQMKLRQDRLKEASKGNAIRDLSDEKAVLEQLEREYAVKSKELKAKTDHEVERLSAKVEAIRREVAQFGRMKSGFLSRILRTEKAQKELEASARLKSAEDELARAVESFNMEQRRLKDEYTRRKEPVLERIRNQEKRILSISGESEVDGSIEDRRSACDALANAVSALLRRNAPFDER